MNTWVSHLSEVPNPRSRECKHTVGEILFLVLTGTLAGIRGLADIADWGQGNLGWLRQTLPYAHGTASHDTIGRVLGMIQTASVNAVFEALVRDLIDVKRGEGLEPVERHIAMDGKALRGSRVHGRCQHALHAWDVGYQQLLAMRWVDLETNEITVMPALIHALDLKGTVVTVDAMGTHLPLVEQITAAGGQCIVGLKGNQSCIHEEVKLLFSQPPKGIATSTHTETGKDHGRIETRETTVLGLSDAIRSGLACAHWPVKSVVKVVRSRTVGEKTAKGTWYFLSTCPVSTYPATRQAQLIRDHWSVENHLHRVLDVSFGDAARHVREVRAVKNLAVLRRLAQTIVAQDPAPRPKGIQSRLNKFSYNAQSRDLTLIRFAKSLEPATPRVLIGRP